MGGICEVIFYADALGEEDRNRVGYYLQEKYGITASYTEYPAPDPKPSLTNLIPDDFEDYGEGTDPNVISLSSRWSSDGAISLDTVEAHDGSGQSMKAVVSAGDQVVKESLRPVDYSEHDGKAAIIWFKGDAGNAGGDVTFRVISDSGVVVGSDTRADGMTIADWTLLQIPIEVDPADPNMWFSNARIELEMSGAGTVYFDDLTFIVPVDIADQILLWELDSSSGAIAEDSMSSGIDGVLSGFADSDWIVDGGDTYQAGDNALQFSGDPADNQIVQAENVTLTGSLDNIFEGVSSWTINQWLYLNSSDTGFTAGGFGNGSADGTRRWLVNWGNGNIGFHGMGEVANIDTGVAYDVGSWQMITIAYDKWTKEVHIYKNAELISTTIGVLLFDTESVVRIGDATSVDMPSPNGLVDDFAIWDGVLPQSDEDEDATNDILSIYASYTCDEGNTFQADITADCRVDLADLAAMAAEWLNCMRVPAEFCL